MRSPRRRMGGGVDGGAGAAGVTSISTVKVSLSGASHLIHLRTFHFLPSTSVSVELCTPTTFLGCDHFASSL
jgi:hypothetical protein